MTNPGAPQARVGSPGPDWGSVSDRSAAPAGAPTEEIPQAVYVAAGAADEKLGQETVVLAMGELLGVVDAFVVTSGRNPRQVRTLVDEIEAQVKDETGQKPVRMEGVREGTWVLMDYGDFIVHVFLDEVRQYYDLEHLWSSAPRVAWREAVRAS